MDTENSAEIMGQSAERYRYNPESASEYRMDFSPPEPKKKRKFPFLSLILIVLALGVGFAAGHFTLVGSNSGNSAILKKLSLIESLVDQYYLNEVDEEKAETGIYNGYISGLNDDYAAYYTADEYAQMTEEDSGEYKGIGVTVYKDSDTGYVCVSDVYKDNPAYNAGIKSGDYILAVDGEGVTDRTLTEVVTQIKSPDTDTVKLTILREDEQFDVEVEKTDVTIDTVDYEMKSNDIGYIAVSQFIENTPQQFSDAIDALTEQNMKALIIDLRDNGGGLLDSCVDMVSRIIPEDQVIVYIKDKDGNREDYNSNSDETVKVPIVVLVNGNTASASEIMTGCLKDYGLATIIGTTTYGKGIVQNIIPLSDGSAVKFTVAKYYTPNGNDIHQKGIEPDVEVKMSDEEWLEAVEDPSKDKQLKKALSVLEKATK